MLCSGAFDACGNATDPDNIDAECQQSSGVIMFICAVYSLLTSYFTAQPAHCHVQVCCSYLLL
jgi:hypothetical protein